MTQLRDIGRQVARALAFTPAVLFGSFIHDGLTHGWKRALLEDLPVRLAMFLYFGLFAASALTLYKLATGDLQLTRPRR